ncbi:MAG: diacylglycerol/lipid kinase family protein [Myxococcota bacterium]
MLEPYVTIVNEAAGGGRCGARFLSLRQTLEAAGVPLEVRHTEGPGHATELARQASASGHRRFLSVGGDGTAFEVLNGLLPAPAEQGRPTLGILPLGTGNSFLRDFDILDTAAAVAALVRGRSRSCDAVRCDHATGSFHYMNILAIGFAARAGDLTNRRFKALGPGGYVAAVLACVARLEHPVDPIRLDGGPVDERPGAFLSFCNTRYTAGSMLMAPEASPTDGWLDVIRCGALPRGRFVATFPRIFRGTHVHAPGLSQTRVRRVELQDDREQPVMVDGEIQHLRLRALEVVPGALEVIA